MKNQSPKSGLLAYLILLTGFFMLLEISFFIQTSTFYLDDYKLIASHLRIPVAVLPGIVFFIVAQLFVHLSYAVSIWMLARLASIPLKLSWAHTQTLGFSLWALALVTILLANECFFANSKFAELMRVVISPEIAKVGMVFMVGIFILVAALSLIGMLIQVYRYSRIAVPSIIGIISLAVGISLTAHSLSEPFNVASANHPNIIIIGVDALRPDYLSFFDGAKSTPNMDKFLQDSTVFAEAMTPLARTFPAWLSILTGQYPLEINARFDLADQSRMNFDNTLSSILQKQGYETIYAMDETRFSNIDKNAGFDRIITPPTGFNDFLVGSLNDFPLSNLVINTALGRWLFPYSYGNRPVYFTYDPNSFLTLLKPVVATKHDKPVFLAVHFCLAHMPYFWAGYSFQRTAQAELHYAAAVQRVDQQVGDFLEMLKQNGMLEHSIVVLLSDHGEALELKGDRITDPALFRGQAPIKRFYPPSFDNEAMDQSAGHGTDVLGLTQYHSVLAFQLNGMAQNQKAIVSGIVSLLDIKPTILALLKLEAGESSGVSLESSILGQATHVQSTKDFFIESDFSPAAIRSVHPEARQVLFAGINFYQIDPRTTHFTVKKSMGDMIISSKQHADIYDHWILALYPQSATEQTAILVDLETGQWTNDLNSLFAKRAPVHHMLQALNHFYQSDFNSPQGLSSSLVRLPT